MSFLTPLFLLGALAVSLPVIFHLIRRTTRDRTLFSSLMFLLPTPPRLTRRSRLEHLLLLALRCLVLCLLALGFARPFLKKAVNDPQPAPGARRIVVLIDTSASMKRANLWADARAKAGSIARRTLPGDQLALSTFDRQVTPVINFDQWNSTPAGERAALVAQKLSAISPGWSGTHLGSALISAAETLADTGTKAATGPAQIILLTDLQEGSRLETLQGYDWPKGIELSVEILKPDHPSNAGLQLVTEANDADSQAQSSVRVRVSNAADSKREQFQVGWLQPAGSDFAGAPTDVYVPPGQSRIIALKVPPPGLAVNRIGLRGDDEDFDNTVYVLPPETARVSVLYFGNDDAKDSKQPLYFLERAFQETRRQAVRVLPCPPDAPLPGAEARAATLFVVTDPLSDERTRALREQLAAGKNVFVALKSAATARTLAGLLELDSLNAEEVRPATYAMLGEIDFRHPLFAPFADPRYSDFTKIHFWKYRRLDAVAIPGARAIAKFDNGDPALLEVPAGKGRVLVLTCGWQPEDCQLALSTKFVPLLYALLDASGAPAALPAQFHVGDVVPLDQIAGAGSPSLAVRLPDGSQWHPAAGETNFSQTLTPGVYTLAATAGGKPAGFAVNLDAAESRTAPLPVDELQRLGAPTAHQAPAAAAEAQRKVRVQNAELENRQKLWRWLLVGAIVVLLFETWLSGRTARRLTAQEGAAT